MRARVVSSVVLSLAALSLATPRALAQTGEDEIPGGSAPPLDQPAGGEEGIVTADEVSALEELLASEPTTAAPRGPELLDQRWGDPAGGPVEPFHGWASFAFFGGRVRGADAFIVSPSLGLRLALTHELDVSASWVLGYGIARVRGIFAGDEGAEPYDVEIERVEAGNPVFAFGWAPRWSEVALRIGLGFALPVAALAQAPTDTVTAAEREASDVVHGAMLAMHGGQDPWRFLPERIAFFVPARIAFGGDLVAGAIDLAGGVTLPVLGGGGGTEAVLQIAGDLAFRILPELRAGLRGTVSAWGIGGERESAQPSLEPWVRLVLGPAFATMRGTLALGGESGFGSKDGAVWAIHVGGGAALDRE